MLQKIITYLQAILQAAGYFEKVFPLCVLKENRTNRDIQPFHYTGNGQLEPCNDFDHFNGSAYFRKNGDPSLSKYEGALIGTSCSDAVTIKFPLKLVLCIPRKSLSCDNEYANDLLAQTLVNLLQAKSTKLRKTLNAYNTAILVTAYCDDTFKLLKEEGDSNVTRDINYTLVYMSMNIDVEVIIDKNCIQTECNISGIIPSVATALDDMNVELREG